MKSASRVKAVLGAVVLAGAVSGIVFAAERAKEQGKEEEVKVAWKDVPVAVQTTIQANLKGGTVTEVEKDTEDGKVAYTAKVKGADGKISEVEVAEDGKLIKIEADDNDAEGGHKVADKDDDKDK